MNSIKEKTNRFLARHFTTSSMDYREVGALFLPLVINQFFISVMALFNTAMISSSGLAAISAVNSVDSLNMLFLSIFVAVATGGTVVVAQYKGAGDADMMRQAGSQAVTAVVLLAVTFSGLLIAFTSPVMTVLFGGADADVLSNARLYFLGSCLSYPGFALSEAVCGVLRGGSDTRASLVISVLTNVLYLLLNVILVMWAKLGVAGLIISLNISRYLGGAAALLYITRWGQKIRLHFREILHLNFPILKKVLFIGIPFAAEQVFFCGGKLLTQTFIVKMGTLAMTTNALCNSLMNLFQIVPGALQLTVVTVVGQCIGKGSVEDARFYTRAVVRTAAIAYLVADLTLLPAYPLLIRMFSAPQELIWGIFLVTLVGGIFQPLCWAQSF
ncbi:MAG: MATE family efflux transporter, partial [Eubacteriales bacterium]|nr:MATE family efflux transporter [Eubacteriales bacterium]